MNLRLPYLRLPHTGSILLLLLSFAAPADHTTAFATDETAPVFQADFEEDTVGMAPRTVSGGGPWLSISTPGNGSAVVVQDTENVFGFGSDNQFLRVESARSYGLTTPNFGPFAILTLSFDFIGRFHEEDGERWLNVNIRSDSTRAHVTSPYMPDATIRGGVFDDRSYGGNNQPIRIDTVINNSTENLTYDTPIGGTAELASGMASLWIYHYSTRTWEQLYEEYIYARNLTTLGDVMNNVYFQMDTGAALRSFDLDNVYVFEGAAVGAHLKTPLPLPGYAAWLEAHFSEEERLDSSVSGIAADPDGDGIVNLLEYALGLDPRSASRDSLPISGIITVDGEHYLSLTFTRPDAIDDVSHQVQATDDPSSWGEEAVLVGTPTLNPDATTTFTYRDFRPIGSSQSRFMRLEVQMEAN